MDPIKIQGKAATKGGVALGGYGLTAPPGGFQQPGGGGYVRPPSGAFIDLVSVIQNPPEEGVVTILVTVPEEMGGWFEVAGPGSWLFADEDGPLTDIVADFRNNATTFLFGVNSEGTLLGATLTVRAGRSLFVTRDGKSLRPGVYDF